MITQKAEPDIMVLRLPTLEAGRAEELRNKLQELDRQGIRKVVLDVRDCGRGHMPEGIEVARLFLASGNVATLRGKTVAQQIISADPSKVVWKGAVSVLISSTTSGAAELLAAAIGGNHRGDVVGERTYGLASEQKVIPLEDGAAVILTVANYYTASGGKSILEEGVAPTVAVRTGSGDQADVVEDDTGAAASPEPAEPRPLSPEDPVLRKALELLKAPARKAA
jgi:carboxyl-terminal processing protease